MKPGGTARQERWLNFVLDSLKNEIAQDESLRPQIFETDNTDLVFAAVDELQAIRSVPNARVALEKGLSAFASKIPVRGMGEFAGAFLTSTARIATFYVEYSHEEPPVPEPWHEFPAMVDVIGAPNKILGIDRSSSYVGDGWDKKLCVDMLNDEIQILETSGPDDRPSQQFKTTAKGPGDWTIYYFPSQIPHRYVCLWRLPIILGIELLELLAHYDLSRFIRRYVLFPLLKMKNHIESSFDRKIESSKNFLHFHICVRSLSCVVKRRVEMGTTTLESDTFLWPIDGLLHYLSL